MADRFFAFRPVILALTSLVVGGAPNFAADTFSEGHMSTLLRNADIVKPSAPLHVLLDESSIIVHTGRSVKATDNDCKIDAIFLSKTLIDAYPKRIPKVKVVFAKEGDPVFTSVVVTKQNIDDYGSGRVDQKRLLESLQLTLMNPEETTNADADEPIATIVPGPYRERRLMLSVRIDSLKKKGTGIKPFEERFQKVESLITAGKTKEANLAIDDLASKLKAQEQLVKQANAHPVAPKVSAITSLAVPANPGAPNSTQQSSIISHNQPDPDFNPQHVPNASDRLRQINEYILRQPQERREELCNKMKKAQEFINNRNLQSAERIVREVETQIQCPHNFFNKLP